MHTCMVVRVDAVREEPALNSVDGGSGRLDQLLYLQRGQMLSIPIYRTRVYEKGEKRD